MELVTHRNRLETLATIGHCVTADLDIVCAPYFDGRIPAGDLRSDDLKKATGDLLAAVDRLEVQAKADLAVIRSADRAETLNRERHERAEKGTQE